MSEQIKRREYGAVDTVDKISEDKPDSLHSPIQEQHIDFLLEEEFACNPQFLTWFLDHVQWNSQSGAGFKSLASLDQHSEWECSAVRSVTTNYGESDVLVVYRSSDASQRIAILIEDKIRAPFQPNQSKRYFDRGNEGKEKGKWDVYWTCLISPERYSPGNCEFDAALSLEKLKEFFQDLGRRSKFRAGVIERALNRFSQTGVQDPDEAMTRFRAYYADKAESEFAATSVKWPAARVAYRDDQWFRFTGSTIPRGAEILYKARAGVVDFTTNTQECFVAIVG